MREISKCEIINYTSDISLSPGQQFNDRWHSEWGAPIAGAAITCPSMFQHWIVFRWLL